MLALCGLSGAEQCRFHRAAADNEARRWRGATDTVGGASGVAGAEVTDQAAEWLCSGDSDCRQSDQIDPAGTRQAGSTPRLKRRELSGSRCGAPLRVAGWVTMRQAKTSLNCC